MLREIKKDINKNLRDKVRTSIKKHINNRSNRTTLSFCLLLLVIILSVSYLQLEPPKTVYAVDNTPSDYDFAQGFITHNYDVKVNGSWFPINQTFLEVPEQNLSLTFAQEKRQRAPYENGWPGFDIYLRRLVKHVEDKDGSYYFSGSGEIEIPIGEFSTQGEVTYNVENVTIHPFELKEYYFAFIKRFFEVFIGKNNSINQGLTYQEMLSVWGPHKLITPFILKNNSKTFPLIGPEEKSYYRQMGEEGKNLEQQIKNSQQWQNNQTNFYWEIKEYPERASYVYFNFNTSLFLDNKNYNATFKLSSHLGLNEIKEVVDLTVMSKITFYDKNSHTEIKIEEDFAIINTILLQIARGVSADDFGDLFLISRLGTTVTSFILLTVSIRKQRNKKLRK